MKLVQMTTFVRFVIVGIVNTFSGLAIIYLVKWVFGWNDIVSNAIGYGAGFCVSFCLNKRWTFEHRGDVGGTLVRFAVVLAFGYLVNLIVLLVGLRVFHLNSYLAQGLGVGPYALATYLGSRYFVFPKPSAAWSKTQGQ